MRPGSTRVFAAVPDLVGVSHVLGVDEQRFGHKLGKSDMGNLGSSSDAKKGAA